MNCVLYIFTPFALNLKPHWHTEFFYLQNLNTQAFCINISVSVCGGEGAGRAPFTCTTEDQPAPQRINQHRWELLADWSSCLKGGVWAASDGEGLRHWAEMLVASRDCWPFMFGVREFVLVGNKVCLKATVVSLAVCDCSQASRHSHLCGQISRHGNSTAPIYWHLWSTHPNRPEREASNGVLEVRGTTSGFHNKPLTWGIYKMHNWK